MEAQNLSTTTPKMTASLTTMASPHHYSRLSTTRPPPRVTSAQMDLITASKFQIPCENLTFSDCNNFTTNDTGLAKPVATHSYWALALLLIPACTLFGNLLVIISVVKFKSLHSPINYFILGLAIADMCVAMAVMPFAVYVQVRSCISDDLGSTSLICYVWAICTQKRNVFSIANMSYSRASSQNIAQSLFRKFLLCAIPQQFSLFPMALGFSYRLCY